MEIRNERLNLEIKIENLIEKWKNGKTIISTPAVQQTIDKGYERLAELKKKEERLQSEYNAQIQKEKNKYSADISIQNNLGKRPTDIEIIDGVLSNNASESHLIGRKKSSEQLKKERNALLNEIKSKAINHELSLKDVSKLTNDVNIAYNFYDNSDDELANNNNNNNNKMNM